MIPLSIHILPFSRTLITCDICFEDCEPTNILSLPCGHQFCYTCWEEHIHVKLNEGKWEMPCLQKDCPCVIPPTTIRNIIGPDLSDKFSEFIQAQQVQNNTYFVFCPEKNCAHIIPTFDSILPTNCKCEKCGFEFCLLCEEKSHAPLSCKELENWADLVSPDRTEKRLFGEFTKKCPRCNVIIEKKWRM